LIYLTEHKPLKRWYFVIYLSEPFSGAPPDKPYQVQLLNDMGQAIWLGHAGKDEHALIIDDVSIPYPVIDAARRQIKGQGDYVNEFGESIPPF
jgi:hypothetical protein